MSKLCDDMGNTLHERGGCEMFTGCVGVHVHLSVCVSVCVCVSREILQEYINIAFLCLTNV